MEQNPSLGLGPTLLILTLSVFEIVALLLLLGIAARLAWLALGLDRLRGYRHRARPLDPLPSLADGSTVEAAVIEHAPEADVVIIVASDDPGDLAETVDRIETSIYGGRTPDGKALNSGVQIIYKQRGATLPPPLCASRRICS